MGYMQSRKKEAASLPAMKDSLTLPNMRNLGLKLATLCAALLFACSSSESPELDRELQVLSQRSDLAVAMVSEALATPADVSSGWSEGVKEIESIVWSLGQLESDVNASDRQRLTAVLYQARAWDDIANVVLLAPKSLAVDEVTSSKIVREELEAKAFPAQIAAQNGFDRALRMACRLQLTQGNVWQEIVVGVQRYSETSDHIRCSH